jgi:thiol:disulfide interchange protein DsbD
MTRALWLLSLLLACPASAQSSAEAVGDHVALAVEAEHAGLRLGAGELALRFRMEEGWHIYWRNPGDSGLPPDIKLTLPAGVTAGEPRWPANWSTSSTMAR